MEILRLRPREDRRLRAGNLWIYANEVDVKATPLKTIQPGSLVRVEDSRGKPLGLGYANPAALLCVRLLTRDVDATINRKWFERRIITALNLRERLYESPHYRLIFGEADGLPGLVVDRFDDTLVVQCSTAGMDALQSLWLASLQSVLSPSGIVLRNDSSARKTEGLAQTVEVIGNVPDEIMVNEHGAKFALPSQGGQKTGWFYDQASNRERLAKYVNGADVLDVFSYYGGWSIAAAKAGASSVSCIDASETAIARVKHNAELNGLEVQTHCGDALAELKAMQANEHRFDVIVVDPPALIKRKKDVDAGLGHYAALNRAAMNLLKTDGILISCSCSFHLQQDALQRILLREARNTNRRLQILELGGQGPDHPVHAAIPETRYLKAIFCRVVGG